MLPQLSFADGETVSTTELSPRFYDAGAELESGGAWRGSGSSRVEHSLTLVLGWSPMEALRIGLENESLLAREENGGGLKDTELTVLRKGLPLGSLGSLDFGSLTILPTDREERNAGLVAATGALLGWELEAADGLTVGFEAKGARFFRGEKAEAMTVPLTEEEAPVAVAAGFDKYRLEQKASAAFEFLHGFSVEASAKHISAWKWLEGREADLELEQKLAYASGKWTLGFGHRNVTRLLSRNGERRRAAVFRPEESALFGTLAWEL